MAAPQKYPWKQIDQELKDGADSLAVMEKYGAPKRMINERLRILKIIPRTHRRRSKYS